MRLGGVGEGEGEGLAGGRGGVSALAGLARDRPTHLFHHTVLFELLTVGQATQEDPFPGAIESAGSGSGVASSHAAYQVLLGSAESTRGVGDGSGVL